MQAFERMEFLLELIARHIFLFLSPLCFRREYSDWSILNKKLEYFCSLVCFNIMQVDLLKRKFGFDDAFNYKEETDLDAALKRSVSIHIA